MDRELKELQQKLREWDKAHKLLSRGDKKEKEIAEKMADDALARIIASLNQDTVATKLDEFMVASREKLLSAPEEIKTKALQHKKEIIRAEVGVSNLKNKEVKGPIEEFYKFKGDMEKFDTDTSGFCTLLEDTHKCSKKVILDTRKVPRQMKKAKRKNVAKCIWSVAIGIGLCVANTELPAVAVFSYGIGIASLQQAGRDIIELL